MKIIEDLLATLNYDAPVRDVRQGRLQTAVMTRHCGLTSTPHDPGAHHGKAPVKKAGHLPVRDARELAWLTNSPSPAESAVGPL
jgi:hypothetical protein